jgi:hypothetical protein
MLSLITVRPIYATEITISLNERLWPRWHENLNELNENVSENK